MSVIMAQIKAITVELIVEGKILGTIPFTSAQKQQEGSYNSTTFPTLLVKFFLRHILLAWKDNICSSYI